MWNLGLGAENVFFPERRMGVADVFYAVCVWFGAHSVRCESIGGPVCRKKMIGTQVMVAP